MSRRNSCAQGAVPVRNKQIDNQAKENDARRNVGPKSGSGDPEGKVAAFHSPDRDQQM